MSDDKKRPLTAEERAECDALKAIWEQKKRSDRGITQGAMAERLGISQPAVGHYLNRRNRLNLAVAQEFAAFLGVPISDFSERLAKEDRAQSGRVMAAHALATAGGLAGTGILPISLTSAGMAAYKLFKGHKSHGEPIGVAEDAPDYEGLAPVHDQFSPVPLISWIAAGELCDAEDPYSLGGAEEFIPCPEKHSAGTYALRVDGPSMDDGTSKGYRDGEIIYVDPEVAPRHNSDVIVRTPGGQATFKRLQETAEGRFLLALNKDWPNRIVPVPEGTVICGVVIGSYQPRSR